MSVNETSAQPLALVFEAGGWRPSAETLRFWGLSEGADGQLSIALPRIEGVREAARHPIAATSRAYDDARIAAITLGRPLVRVDLRADLKRLVDDPSLETILFVCQGDEIGYADLDELVMRTRPAPHGLALGLVTGPTPAALKWMLAKTVLLSSGQSPRPEGDLSLFACPPVGGRAIHGDGELLWWDDLTPAAVAKVTSRAYASAALLSHANGIDGNFNQVVLCPVRAPAPDARGPRPSCLHGELCQRDPSGRLARVHPDTIQAPIVFYDTCAGFLAHGGIASLEASLGTGFIEGPAGAFVTSVRKKMSDPFAALLFRALLKDGVALGTIARHLNTYQRSEYGELPSFFVIGDPAFRSPGASVDEDTRVDDIAAWRSHAVSCKPMTSSRDDLVVAQGASAGVMTFDLRRRFGSPDDPVILARLNAAEAGVEVSAFSLSSELAWLRWAMPQLADARQLIEQVCAGLRTVAPTASRTGLEAAAEALAEAAYMATNLQRAAGSCVWTPELAEELRRSIYAFARNTANVSARVCSGWLEARQWLVLHHYYSHHLEQLGPERRLARRCPACGEPGWCEKRFGRSDGKGHERRMWTCIRCGVTADLPEGVRSARVTGPASIEADARASFTATIDLARGSADDVVVQPYFGGFGSGVIRAILPEHPLAAPPDAQGQVTIPFEVHVEKSCPPGLYSLVVIAARMGKPLLFARYVSIVPQTSQARGS